MPNPKRRHSKARRDRRPHVRPLFVVMTPPALDAHLGFDAIPKPLDRQALVAKLPVERFVRAILPGLSGIDEGRINPNLLGPA